MAPAGKEGEQGAGGEQGDDAGQGDGEVGTEREKRKRRARGGE